MIVCSISGCHDPASNFGSYCARGEHAAVGRKDDGEKPRYDLLPLLALEVEARVLTYGATKYAPDNWRKVDGWRWRYFGAALRHLFAWFGGERLDPESGLPHLGHALCCVAFLAELDSASGPDVKG